MLAASSPCQFHPGSRKAVADSDGSRDGSRYFRFERVRRQGCASTQAYPGAACVCRSTDSARARGNLLETLRACEIAHVTTLAPSTFYGRDTERWERSAAGAAAESARTYQDPGTATRRR